MNVFSDKRVFWGSLLLFSQQGATIAAESFINYGLIDIYEPGTFVYFYAAAAIASSSLIALSQLIVHKYEREYFYILYGVSILVFISSIVLLDFHASGLIFATTISLITALDLIGIANNTSVFTAFNIQELHRATKTLTISSCIATIIFCMLLPVLIDSFGISVLLYANMGAFAVCLLSVKNLKPLAVVEVTQKKTHANPFFLPLFRLTILYSVFSWASLTLVDYAFKTALMKSFSGEAVGIFSASFLGLVAFVTILTQVFGAPTLVERFGGLNSLFFAPIIAIFFGLLVVLFPHSWIVFLLYFVQSVYVLGVCYVGSQTLINSVPRQAHFRAQSLLLIIVLLISDVVIVPSFFFLVGTQASERVIVAGAMICIVLSLLVLHRIRRLYPDEMKKRVQQPRFISFRNFVADEPIVDEDIGKLVLQVGHRYSVESTLLFLHRTQTDPIPLLVADLDKLNDVINFQGRVRVLARLPQERVEIYLAELLNCRLAILPNALPYAIAMRSLTGLGVTLRTLLTPKILAEGQLITSLKDALVTVRSDIMLAELTSRLDLAKRRFFFYLAAVNSNPRAVLNVLPSILDETFVKTEQIRRADAIDYLDAVISGSQLRKAMREVLFALGKPMDHQEYANLIEKDDWLVKICHMETLKTGGRMNETEKALFLSRVQLFEPLPAEMLELIAASVREEAFPKDSHIFSKGDEVDKVYMVVSGEVEIRTNESFVNCSRFALFGEIGMLGRGIRTADAIAISDVQMLVIEKQEFLQMLEDVPEIAKQVIKMLTSYLERISLR